MKRNYFLVRAIVLLFVISHLGSCSDKPELFIKQSTGSLTFEYEASSEIFKLRTNGPWSISNEGNDWISITPESGRSDGEVLEEINISVSRNTGIQREATLILSAAGKDLAIKITQAEGLLSMGAPVLFGEFVLGKDIEDVKIGIPYSKAFSGESLTFSLIVSGEGATGINSITNHKVILTDEEGVIDIPLSGKPTTAGQVNFVVSTGDYNASLNTNITDSSLDPIGTVYLDEKFDKMLWGGDYVRTARGIKGEFKKDASNKDIVDETKPVSEVGDGTDGSSDFFATMAESYRVLRGIADWSGLRVYERPDHIKMGTGTSRDGFVVTPALSAIKDEKVNIKVSFSIARWSTSSDKVYIEVLNGGEASVEFVTVTAGEVRSWGEKEFFITGAKATTQIKFISDPTKEGRFFLDNIHVSKID